MTREEFTYELEQDAKHEEMMRRDYDYFLDSIDSELSELNELLQEISRQHEAYDWEMDLRDIIV